MTFNKFKVLKIVCVCMLILLAPLFFLQIYYRVNPKASIDPEVIIIPGAGIRNDYPTNVLRYRLDKGLEIYLQHKNAGKKTVFLVSGDNKTLDYNEPAVMAAYLSSKGVLESEIVQDFGGRRTIDTCKRAKEVFKVESAYIVSQEFHLPRFSYLCQRSGIKVVSIRAQDMVWNSTVYQYVREIGSSWFTIFEANFYNGYIKGDGTERDI
jgi:vancomycin permeability regulator SanA